MKRKICFRVWDKERKFMLPAEQILHIEFNKNGVNWIGGWVQEPDPDDKSIPIQALIQIDNFILQQYTGLKDKNGKEIYDGDIIEVKGKGLVWETLKVKWGRVGWEMCNKGLVCYDLWDVSDEIEITGNIYENKKLLKS